MWKDKQTNVFIGVTYATEEYCCLQGKTAHIYVAEWTNQSNYWATDATASKAKQPRNMSRDEQANVIIGATHGTGEYHCLQGKTAHLYLAG